MSDYAISVKNVSKKFKLYHEKRDSIFEAATSFFQKKRQSEILQELDEVSINVNSVSLTINFSYFCLPSISNSGPIKW